MRVLVADDNFNNRQLVADILETMGHEAIMASDGLEALALALSTAPDLVILDVGMPGLSGFEVCQRLKQDSLTMQIPVLMITALNDAESRVRGLAVGADDYLTKPFNPRELMERVKTRLRMKVERDEMREKQQVIRATFERFVAPAVVERLLQDSTHVRLGGSLQEVTVLFTDLENFTSMSEMTDPEQLLSVLNQYHTYVVQIIQEAGGTIDKFIGDGVMALFNTPLAQTDHAERAVRAALHIRNGLSAFHQQFSPLYQLRVNVGIHSGMAVVGNVGAPDIMDFTAVGDTVNLAARLQQTSSGGQILVSEATYARLAGRVAVMPMGELTVRGRTGAVTAYEVLGMEAG